MHSGQFKQKAREILYFPISENKNNQRTIIKFELCFPFEKRTKKELMSEL